MRGENYTDISFSQEITRGRGQDRWMSVSPRLLWCNKESQTNQEHIVRSHLIKSESLNVYNANTFRDTTDGVEMRNQNYLSDSFAWSSSTCGLKAPKFVPQVEARVLSGSLTHLSYIITSIVPKAPHSDFSIAPLTLMLYWSLAWPLSGWRSTQHLLGVRGELEESFCTVRILRDLNLLNLDKCGLLDGCNSTGQKICFRVGDRKLRRKY